MSNLHELQHRFMDYLLAKSTAVVNDIQSTPVLDAKDRLDIYASAYKLRLKEAITTDYDKLASYLGDEQFDQLMEQYIVQYPSHTDSLRYFSVNLPELVRDESPFNEVKELYEIASIERAFANSFDAKDLPFTTITELASLPATAWGALQFKVQDSLQLLNLRYNSFPIWKALSDEITPPKAEMAEPTEWVLWRRSNLVSHYRVLSKEESVLIRLAINGESFSVMCESLLDYYSEEEIPMKAVGYLQSWIQEEMLSGLSY
tara:strand:- start:2086 stop:2865 length:780 start_codon:yes stop_codon:yes gene_type:complete